MPCVLSYSRGPSVVDLPDQSLGLLLGRVAVTHGSRDAVVSCHQRLRFSYADLYLHVQRAARALLSLGMEPGDRLGLLSANCVEWLVAQYAAASIGVIVVAINPGYRRRELKHILGDAGVSVLLVGLGLHGQDFGEILASIAPGGVEGGPRRPSDEATLLRTIVHFDEDVDRGGLTWKSLLDSDATVGEDRLEQLRSAVRSESPACIYYTSGTTGSPKGTVVSHRALMRCGSVVSERLHNSEQDRLCLPVALCHVFGSAVGGLAAMSMGSALILPSNSFDPGACLAAIESEQCTVLYGVPTMFRAQVDHPGLRGYRLQSLRTGVMAGAPCAPDLIQAVMDRMHIPELTVSFGMTEILAALHTSPGDSLDRWVSTVGTPLPAVECKIVDPVDDKTLPRETAGELCARGYGLMLGYWNDQVATAAAIDADGWMHTGDLGLMRDDGYVKIVGRIKDMVIRSGEKIHPSEVESCLSRHPKVREVHITAVSDAVTGEELCAWIKLRQGVTAAAEELRSFCRGEIADFKIPRHIRFVEAFPCTATGKVQKSRMRELERALRDANADSFASMQAKH